MKKGERLDIDLSVIAIEPILTGGISIHSSVRRLHRRRVSYGSRRQSAPKPDPEGSSGVN